MLKRKAYNRQLKTPIIISRHAVKRAIQRGDFDSGEPSRTYARALSYLKTELCSRGKSIERCLDESGEWFAPKGKTQLITWDGWVGVLRPVWAQKSLKLVTVYPAASSAS